MRRRLSVHWGARSLENLAYTRDISAGGAFVESDAIPEVGTLLRIAIDFAPGAPVLIHARVARVLRTADDCGFGLDFGSAAPAVAVELAPLALGEKASLAEGDVLGECFVIRRLLGLGGMGEVYDADDRLMNRRVAIKVSRAEAGDAPLLAEAQALAAFRDPALPAAFSLGKHKGRYYFVMERLSGSTLLDVMKKQAPDRPLPLGESLQILRGIGKALSAVHGVGLAHRDLKPANVMLVPPGRVVLLDFGIVRQERHAADDHSISGSPYYMAPETVRGAVRVGEGHLADLYSFGVIAFELLTGHVPIDGTSTERILANQVNLSIPRLRLERPDLPPVLDALVFDLLQKDPHERPDSIETVLVELDRLLVGSRRLTQ